MVGGIDVLLALQGIEGVDSRSACSAGSGLLGGVLSGSTLT